MTSNGIYQQKRQIMLGNFSTGPSERYSAGAGSRLGTNIFHPRVFPLIIYLAQVRQQNVCQNEILLGFPYDWVHGKRKKGVSSRCAALFRRFFFKSYLNILDNLVLKKVSTVPAPSFCESSSFNAKSDRGSPPSTFMQNALRGIQSGTGQMSEPLRCLSGKIG